MSADVVRFLIENAIPYDPSQILADISSVRIGREPTLVAFPRCDGELLVLLRYLYASNVNYKLVGGMTNLLPSDNKYDGVIICTSKMRDISFCGNLMTVSCGVRLSGAIIRAAEYSLGGLEALSGIPGTVGGMIYSNAGAFGSEISDFLVSARLYSPSLDREFSLDKCELSFGYRDSILKESDYALISATLGLSSADKGDVLSEISKLKERRRATQPIGEFSLGSVFKRVGDSSAAYYIDKSGLKGYRIGGAAVSEKHAGFIVNAGGATALDYKRLVTHIEDTVYSKYGITLEKEVEYL